MPRWPSATCSTEPIEYREGDEITTVRKLNGLNKYANITLKWGITDCMELADWHQLVVDDATPLDDARRNVVIRIQNEAGEDKAAFEITKAWPCKYDPTRPERQGQRGGDRHPGALQRRHPADLNRGAGSDGVSNRNRVHAAEGLPGQRRGPAQEGVMRLATAADEILPLKDPRVKQNPAYLAVIVLSRVITRLGSVPDVNTKIVEGLFASDSELPPGALRAVQRRWHGRGIGWTAPAGGHAAGGVWSSWGKPEALSPRQLYEEMAFIAYHFHWPRTELAASSTASAGDGARRSPPST